MSVEFRQRTPAEYAQIFWNRKWLIVLPTLAVSIAIAYVVWRLPNVYESTTLLTVRPPTISSVETTNNTSNTLTMRINSISQEVTSRSSLQPLMEKYQLYGQSAPMETLVERMRANIVVNVVSRNDVTNAFHITFRGSDPKVTQAVTAELASKYVNGQLKQSNTVVTQTTEFFQQQLVETKAKLDQIESARLRYMRSNLENLPSSNPALLGQLTGLSDRQTALINEIGRMRDQRAAYSGQLEDLREQYKREQQNLDERISDPKETTAYAQLTLKKAQLEADLENMRVQLKEKNPDVIAKKKEVAQVQKAIDEMMDEHKLKSEQIKKRLAGIPDLRINSLEANIRLIDGEISRQEKERARLDIDIAGIRQRINSVPGVEVQLEALTREFNTQKAFYDDLMQKARNAEMSTDVVVNQQGETIQVVDSANLPEKPVAPKRGVLMGMGLGLGLGLGLLLAALFEVPRLLRIQSTDDAEHYTGLPVLVAMPELRTPREERNLRLRHALFVTAGIAIALLSIPALAYALKFSGIFNRFAA